MRTLVAIGWLGVASCGRELETLDPALVALGQFTDDAGSTLELRDDGTFTWRRDAFGYRVDGFAERIGRRVELVCPGGGSPELPATYTCASANGRQFLVPDQDLATFVLQLRDRDGGERRWLQRELPPHVARETARPLLPMPYDTLYSAQATLLDDTTPRDELHAGGVDYHVKLTFTAARFTWTSGGCWGADEQFEGTSESLGPFLVLRPDRGDEGTRRPNVLVPARAGSNRCWMVLEWTDEYLAELASTGRSSPLSVFTSNLPISDDPIELPEPFARWYYAEPLTAHVIAIEAQRTEHTAAIVRVDVGARDGAFPGLCLQRLPRGAGELELREVFERSSLGRTRGESGGRPWPVGTECSSRKPDPLRPSTSEAER